MPTRFPTGIIADITGDVTGNLTGNVTGNLTGNVTGNLIGNLKSVSLSKAADYALNATEKLNQVFLLAMTAASKVYTLGLAAGAAAFVYNSGAETFTLKNVSGDTGTSVATGKLYLVVGSATANQSTVVALN
jgi:hypothetical protein